MKRFNITLIALALTGCTINAPFHDNELSVDVEEDAGVEEVVSERTATPVPQSPTKPIITVEDASTPAGDDASVADDAAVAVDTNDAGLDVPDAGSEQDGSAPVEPDATIVTADAGITIPPPPEPMTCTFTADPWSEMTAPVEFSWTPTTSRFTWLEHWGSQTASGAQEGDITQGFKVCESDGCTYYFYVKCDLGTVKVMHGIPGGISHAIPSDCSCQ